VPKKGIWHRTKLDSLKTDSPQWTTVLNLDAIPPSNTGTAKTWVWHGSTLLNEGPASRWDRALIRLSPGGSDADTCREFDLTAGGFVDPDDGRYTLPDPAKTTVSYRSRDEVLVATDFGGDGSTLTDIGYPRVVKSWRRGTPINDLVMVFECEKTDIAAHLKHDEYLVSKFVLIIQPLSILFGIVLNCLTLMESFLSFPIDDYFLTKDEIISEC